MNEEYDQVKLRLQNVADYVEVMSQIQMGLEVLFELSSDLLCITNPDGYFVKVNSAWEVLGWTEEELLSKPYLEFVHPDDREDTIAKAQELMEGQKIDATFSNRFMGKDGSAYRLRWRTVRSATDRAYFYAAARIDK